MVLCLSGTMSGKQIMLSPSHLKKQQETCSCSSELFNIAIGKVIPLKSLFGDDK